MNKCSEVNIDQWILEAYVIYEKNHCNNIPLIEVAYHSG